MIKKLEMTRIQNGFINNFDVADIFIQEDVSLVLGKYSFDILKFDKWLHEKHGYSEELHGSIETFVRLKFGEVAVSFIYSLIRDN